ncbi:MAG: SpoIIE family protein phosphatase [Ignavibacteriales bacterium]|nr:SpoIIE family protein phosphatase [Ignavibacteriales bacterium]
MIRSKNIISILILLVLILTDNYLAQTDFTTETFSIKDGLSSNNIRDIIQDKYGYIWIATVDGVNVYDGFKNIIYKNNPDDSTSLPSNVTYTILEDKEGTIWITSDEGLVKYNRNNNSFTTFKPFESTAELANRTIHIYEDSKNNLWVSTQDGNLLFNRSTEKFQRYDVMGIDNSIIRFVNSGGPFAENSKGDLYCLGDPFGLLKFDYKTSLFIQVAFKESGNFKLLLGTQFDITADNENNLWIATSFGLSKINIVESKIIDVTPFNKANNLNRNWDNAAIDLLVDSNQNIWVGTSRNGAYLFDSKLQKFEKILFPVTSNFFMGFYEDNSGLIWVGSSRGVIKYDSDRKPFVTYTLPDKGEENNKQLIYSFAASKVHKNNVWLSTVKGIYLFNYQSNELMKASLKDRKLAQFDETEIFKVLEFNNTLWIATVGSGLYSYNINSGEIYNYRHKVYDNTTLFNNIVHNLGTDKNENLWVATHEGLSLLKNKDNKFIPIPSFFNRQYDENLLSSLKIMRENKNPTSSIIKVGDYADLSKEFVLRNDSKVMIYSMGEGLAQWDMVDYGWLESENGDILWTGGEFKNSFHASGALKNRIKIGALNLKAGRYKLRYKSDDSHSVESYNTLPPQDSSYWGTQIFTLTDDDFNAINNLVKTSDDKTYLTGEDTKVIFCDSKNGIWVGTDDGFSHVDSNLVIENYIQVNANSNSLSNNLVRDIKEDNNGNIWIATADGLNKFDIVNNKFSVIRENDGLPSSNISSIEIDNEGDLWISSLKGISKIELNEKGDLQIVVNYDVKDGLQGYEFIQSSSFKDESGKLYFGGVDGFNAFYPGSSNRTPPFLSIQDIRISNKSIKKRDDFGTSDLNQLSELSLSHDQNDLSFEFASIHFSRPDKNRLMYKLDGVDEDWQVGDRRFASYTNLNPGDYTFHLKGSNGDGIWNKNIRSINIHISPPWYNNWTAYSIYAALFFGFLYGVRKFEMGRQQKNAQIQESRLKIEAAEAKAEVAETKALIVQAENERKSKELEEARMLQLSMLPRELPQLPNLDIAVYMKTATEVGGDYYDFHIGLDGTLTVVLGDATGHGMKAGTMVTTTKSLFNVLAPNPNIVETFHEMTRCLKLMQMEKLSMCMTMLKISGNKIQMSAAGMPPVFIYKSENQSIEEHVMKGMPLGTFSDFPYTMIESNLSSGDTILLMSDGFPELFNDDKEMYGYKRARNYFEEIAGESPEEIILKLKNAGSDWVNDNDPDDDVTFVVIKVK